MTQSAKEIFMPGTLTITRPDRKKVRLGRLSQFRIDLPANAAHGKTIRRPPELHIPQQSIDPVGAATLFDLYRGDGHGEVKIFQVEIELRHANGQPIADVKIGDASLLSLAEGGTHPARCNDFVIVGKSMTYEAANGQVLNY
jgi:hypothetical protein